MTGAVALLNALVGDLTAILGLIEFVRPDKLIVRYLLAPGAMTQFEMNQMCALDSELYLPFRHLPSHTVTYRYLPLPTVTGTLSTPSSTSPSGTSSRSRCIARPAAWPPRMTATRGRRETVT